MLGRSVTVTALGVGGMLANIESSPADSFLRRNDIGLGQTSLLFRVRNAGVEHRMVIDCGTQWQTNFRANGLTPGDPDSVLITHAHPDHIGGLGELLLARKFDWSEAPKLIVYLPKELYGEVWPKFLQFQLETLGSLVGLRHARMDDYCEARMVEPGQEINLLDGTARIKIIQAKHHLSAGAIQPCYGIWLMTYKEVKLYYSGDSQFDLDLLMPHWLPADLIIQDGKTGKEKGEGSIHSHILQLASGKVPREVRGKMRIAHYQKNFADYNILIEEAGLLGFLQQGEVLDLEDLEGCLTPFDPVVEKFYLRR